MRNTSIAAQGLLLALCGVISTQLPAAIGRPERIPAKVVTIVEGDTLQMVMADGTIERVRLMGIDTQETGHPSEAGRVLWG